MTEIQKEKQQVRLQNWTNIIKERMETGMSIKECCAKYGVKEATYYYWLRVIRTKALESKLESSLTENLDIPQDSFLPDMKLETPMSSFVEIHPNFKENCDYEEVFEQSHSNKTDSELTLKLGDITLLLTDRTSSTLLARTLEVIRNAQ